MHCCDTGDMPAIRCEHVDTQDISMIDKLIAFFKEMCNGNGDITLIVSNGKIQRFDPTSRIPKIKRRQEDASLADDWRSLDVSQQ